MTRLIPLLFLFILTTSEVFAASALNGADPDPVRVTSENQQELRIQQLPRHESPVQQSIFYSFAADTLAQNNQIDNESEKPATARLDQNYPNPFNPLTTISFRLPENSDVRIEVFDQLGRSMETILNETRVAGEHNLVYDASHLPSGTYLYRMELRGLERGTRQAFTRKFTLIK